MDKNPKHISQKQQEEFERYLLNQMEAIERYTFIEKLKTQPELAAQFEEFEELISTIEEAGLRAKLDAFHSEFKNTEHQETIIKKPSFNRSRYLMAASFAMLVALSGVLFFNRLSPNEKLYNEHFVPDPGLPTVMGENDNYTFNEAMVDYKHGDYNEAIEKWERQLFQKPKNDTLNYFLGSAHLADGNSKKAIDYLENVVDDKKSIFYNDANTYLGLALLKTGQIPEAKKALEKGSTTKGREILAEIE